MIRDRFTTLSTGDVNEDENLYGDFEDLETGEKVQADDNLDDNEKRVAAVVDAVDKQLAELDEDEIRRRKKIELKKKFDEE